MGIHHMNYIPVLALVFEGLRVSWENVFESLAGNFEWKSFGIAIILFLVIALARTNPDRPS